MAFCNKNWLRARPTFLSRKQRWFFIYQLFFIFIDSLEIVFQEHMYSYATFVRSFGTCAHYVIMCNVQSLIGFLAFSCWAVAMCHLGLPYLSGFCTVTVTYAVHSNKTLQNKKFGQTSVQLVQRSQCQV